jgi:hypothetical protein
MPLARLERTRASLPEGYQFGDARWQAMPIADYIAPMFRVPAMWRLAPPDYSDCIEIIHRKLRRREA